MVCYGAIFSNSGYSFNLWLYKPFKHKREIIPLLLFFGIATAAEAYDEQIYRLAGEMISGHTIKHLFMAAAGCYIVKMIERRAAVQLIGL